MGRIATIITNWFEDSEYVKPAEAFENAGHEVITVGLKKKQVVEGKRGNARVEIEQTLDEVTVDDFDALLIPGGYSPDKLRVNKTAVQFVHDFVKSGKPVFAICHAPQLLITAQVIEGRRITGWKSLIQDIKNAGAEFVDDEVVIDDNLVSSRSPQDLPMFIRASLEKLEKEKK